MKDPVDTVIVEAYRNLSAEERGSNAYKGLRIHALNGLHQYISGKATEYFEPGGSLLDLAAGSGALSLRMSDLGFTVSSTDYVQENFRLDPCLFTQANLNEPFSDVFPSNFDSIVASEIIEHLENPRHFARECYKLLKPGGRMLLSTPNVESAASITSLMRTGLFTWFLEANYHGDGHISPLTHWVIHKSFEEAGFRLISRSSFGEMADRYKGSPRLALLEKVIGLLSTKSPDLSKEIYVIALEKPH